MSAPLCVVCSRPTADGFACMVCGVDRPARQLGEIRDMTPAARMVAYGQGSNGIGGGTSSGKPESRMELNLTATSRLDAVQNNLTTWCRLIASERGIGATLPATPGDPITAASGWLSGQGEWMRHRPEVSEFLQDVAECARIVRSLARGRQEQRFLGPCGCEIATEVEPGITRIDVCDGDVYALVHPDGSMARTGTCRVRTCKAVVDTSERQAWLDGQVRDHAFADREIADALGISVKTIRSWATERPESRDHRGKLIRSATPARLHAHAHDREGKPLYLFGDVVELAATDAARREERRSQRVRQRDDQPVAC